MFATMAQADPAVVVKEGFCGLKDGNGSFALTDDVHTTSTMSQNGNAKLSCKATVDPSASGKAVKYGQDNGDGFCGILTASGFVTATDWQETVSASGEAMLTCHYNANQQ